MIDKKILAIIPARGGSKGLKNKNIRLIDKKPVIQYSIESSKTSKFISKTVVTTDSTVISLISKNLNCQVIKRPKILSTDKSKLEPVISHTLKYLEKNENYVPDIIVLLQNTSPLRTSKHIDEAIDIFLRKKYSSLLSVTSSHNFIWRLRNDKAIPINYVPKNRPNRQEMKKEFVENGAIYITTHSAFQKNKCRISGKIGIYEMKPHESYQIDSLEEFNLIKNILKSKKKK